MMSDQKTNIEQLRKGEKLTGRVSSIELFGAFVDVGLDQHGLVHISRLKRGRTNRVDEVVKVGQEVETWVHRISSAEPQLELTMVRPVEMRWRDITPGKQFRGKVVRVESYGAFVDIGAERPGLVHVSEMRDDYVKDPAKIVGPGDEVSVLVLELDRKKKQIRLSMRAEEPLLEEEAPEPEELPTAMEVAMRMAMEGAKGKQTQAESPEAGKKSDLDEILSRTLAAKPENKPGQ